MTDRAGQPVGLMEISVSSMDGTDVGRTKSGEDGRYFIPRLRPGRYRLFAILGRTAPPSLNTEIDLHEGQNTFDIRL